MASASTPSRLSQNVSAGPSSRNTPASSPAAGRRPIDIATSRANTAGTDPDQRRARREQLRNFYNLDEAQSKGESSTSTTRVEAAEAGAAGKVDRLNIDSPGFDAGAYYQDLIGRSSLVELMSTATKLSAEVGNLNSSRHSLVYNHHHQLFSAGDTIQLLNVRTPQLLSIVTSLQDSFASISQLADSVAMSADTLLSGQQEVDKLEGKVQRLRLMACAHEPPERLKAVFADVEPELSILAEGGDQRANSLLHEAQTFLHQVSTAA